MVQTLQALRKKVVIGFVGGSDFAKITGQLRPDGRPGQRHYLYLEDDTQRTDIYLTSIGTLVTDDFDYCFAENGLTAYKQGRQLASQSFITFVGEEKYKTLVNFILHYVADLDIPVKRYIYIISSLSVISVS